MQPVSSFRDRERKNRDSGEEKSTAKMGGGSPWRNVYFAFRDLSNGVIPVELNSLGGRWSFNGGDINLARDIISSSLSMTRENLSPMKFPLPFLSYISSFFLFFRGHYYTTFPYIFIYKKFQLTNRSIWKKKEKRKRSVRCTILELSIPPKNLPKLQKLILRP